MSIAEQRVVMVTGASRGLGRKIAICFGKAGDRIIVHYLSRRHDAEAVAKEIIASGGNALTVRADVRIAEEVDRMMHTVTEQWGEIDVLINNAGLARDGVLLRMKEQDWDAVVSTNLHGPFHCVRAAAGRMSEQGSGHIINIASITGIQGREGQANYSASKAGLIGFTKACARELGPFNIKVNAVLPGYIPTDMGATVSEAVLARVVQENVLHRTSDPNEVAEFIRHLSLMNNVSGQVFNLDSRIW